MEDMNITKIITSQRDEDKEKERGSQTDAFL
jgi:hypothetical protein